MAKEENIKLRGVVIEALPSANFRVRLENDYIISCTISGKIRQNNIRILLQDSVDVEITPYDVSRGRIVYRHQ